MPDIPDYPGVLRLSELLLLIRSPITLLPDSPELLGVYEKLLRRLFGASWSKAVPFHALALQGLDSQELLSFILSGEFPDSNDYNRILFQQISVYVLEDVLRLNKEEQRLLGGLLAVASQDE